MCGRLSVGKSELNGSAVLVGAAMCSTCWCGAHQPLAIMPSAESGPDHKHALEAHWREWVFPFPGIDRLVALRSFALPIRVDACA